MDITLRAATVSDAAELLDIYAYYVNNTAITFEYDVPSADEFAERIANTLKKYPYIVAECDGKAVGYAYAAPFKARAAYDWAVETSIYVQQGLTHCGIGETLHNTLESALKAMGVLNMNACIAFPDKPDIHLDDNSARFHEHIGYRTVGEFSKCGYKFDNWYNMMWMEKHIGEHCANPPKIKPFCDICGKFFEDLK